MSLASIMVAPNGACKTTQDHPQLPVTIVQTVAAAKACFAAGAGALHAHLRDTEQKHLLDKGRYWELQAAMAEQVPAMDVQLTTEAGGIYDAAVQRQFIASLQPSYISLSYAEMLRDTAMVDVQAFYRDLIASPMRVQHIFYSADQLQSFIKYIAPTINMAAGDIWQSHQALFVLGRYHRQQQSQPADLTPFIQVKQSANLPMQWAVCAFGKSQFECLLAAHQLGGCMRIGFENSLLGIDGQVAANNAAQVDQLVNLLQSQLA